MATTLTPAMLICLCTEGLAAVQVGRHWGYIDIHGRMRIPARFNETVPPIPVVGCFGGPPDLDPGAFSGGLAAVRHGDRWGFIDTRGRTVIPFQFATQSMFRDGVARVCRTDSCDYIDSTGRRIWSSK